MEAWRRLAGEALAPALGVFAPPSPYGAPALIGALIFALAWFVVRRRQRGRAIRLRAFVRALFPRRILRHRSSAVDLGLWTLNAIVLAAGYAWLGVGSLFWRDRVVAALGGHGALAVPPGAAILVSTLAELLAYELGYWASHYAFHRLPALWAFHKVHHSAEVMTALTEMRQHPVEIIVFMNVIALTTGLAFGLMTFLFGPGAGHLTLFNANIVLALFMLTWGHLRHSHLWIPFPGLAGKLFQSPAHHQVHHSTDPRHFDKNLGFALAVWDWAFGTLHIPTRQREVREYGVGEDNARYATVTGSLAQPFAEAGARLRSPSVTPEGESVTFLRR